MPGSKPVIWTPPRLWFGSCLQVPALSSFSGSPDDGLEPLRQMNTLSPSWCWSELSSRTAAEAQLEHVSGKLARCMQGSVFDDIIDAFLLQGLPGTFRHSEIQPEGRNFHVGSSLISLCPASGVCCVFSKNVLPWDFCWGTQNNTGNLCCLGVVWGFLDQLLAGR